MSFMKKCRILFLSANPEKYDRLALDEECRAIEQKILAADHGAALEFLSKWAVRPDDLLQFLSQYRPHVVHFSGHGTATGEIVLLDEHQNPKPVSKAALRQLFATLKDNIKLVVLNLCDSRAQAEAIAEIIDCAIGMKTAIGDDAAIVFAASFYRAIGFGRSVQNAFDQGKTALMLQGIPEETTPDLIARKGVDPAELFLRKLEVASSVRPSRAGTTMNATEPSASAVWREKLQYLQQQEAMAFDPALKFALAKQIQEAQAKLRDLGM